MVVSVLCVCVCVFVRCAAFEGGSSPVDPDCRDRQSRSFKDVLRAHCGIILHCLTRGPKDYISRRILQFGSGAQDKGIGLLGLQVILVSVSALIPPKFG